MFTLHEIVLALVEGTLNIHLKAHPYILYMFQQELNVGSLSMVMLYHLLLMFNGGLNN